MDAARAHRPNKISDRSILLSLEDESEEFKEDLKRLIDEKKLLHAEEYYHRDGTYTGMEIALSRGDDSILLKAKVKKRALDPEGCLIGTPNDNPLLDTSRYEVEYEDGELEVISTNIIAENILT